MYNITMKLLVNRHIASHAFGCGSVGGGLGRGSLGCRLGLGSGGDAFLCGRGDQLVWPQHDDQLPEARPPRIMFSRSLTTRPTPNPNANALAPGIVRSFFPVIVSYIIKILLILINITLLQM